MRILYLNKYLFPKGGSETHLLRLAEGVSAAGDETWFFGMEHPDNSPDPARQYTLPFQDYATVRSWIARIRAFGRIVYSKPAYEAVDRCLAEVKPDVAHAHNIYHQLSPSVLDCLRKSGVPTVLTAHDYKLVCPTYSLHDGSDVCYRCQGHRYWNVLTSGCSRNGIAGAAALAAAASIHHWTRIYQRSCALVIAPSCFLRDRLLEGGWDAKKVRVLHNAIDLTGFTPNPRPGEFLLFVGRLGYEKGLETLLAAAAQAPEVPLVIAGDGPLRKKLQSEAAGCDHIQFLGTQPHQRIRQLMSDCRGVVLPSRVPENCPMTILEAFAAGKPAIASNIGGIPEIVNHQENGLLVTSGNVDELTEAMLQIWINPVLSLEYGAQARKKVEANHDQKNYLSAIRDIYSSFCSRSPESETPKPQPALVEDLS